MTKEQRITLFRYVTQRFALDRFEDKALVNLQRFYKKARKQTLADIQKAIKRDLNHPSRIRLQALLKEIDTAILLLTQKISKPVIEAVAEAGVYSYKNTNAILSWDGKVDGFNNVAMSAGQIASLVETKAIGDKTINKWMWDAVNADKEALKAEISAARIRGVGYKKLMRELPDKYDKLFKDDTARNNLETVVKSYIQAINAKSHKDIYEANREVIKEVEWSAIMENGNTATGRGTCPRCMALDGRTFPSVALGAPLPLHPRCRCMYVPVTKTWKELGFDVEERKFQEKKWAERNHNYKPGQEFPGQDGIWPRQRLAYGLAEGDYASFWANIGKTRGLDAKAARKWQDNAIGPVRANLVREGVVDFQDIIYKNGNLIPLKTLVKDTDALKLARKRTTQEK